MTAERWERTKEILEEALRLALDRRPPYLDSACGTDDALRAEVESLIAAHEAAGTQFLAVADILAVTPSRDPPGPPSHHLSNDADASVFIGRRVGIYQLQSLLGRGGMGEVYRARDTKLGRDVAIKILPRHFTSDSGRLARFEREARIVASLNHPHIGAIHGLEDADGVHALVLELVEGETLADRIARGRLPLSAALIIARQLANALDAAHEKGIVHRDLKPANIAITKDGVVKVLDFGLAKLDVGVGGSDLSLAPTMGATREGAILGTPAYMSPEQARGHTVDKRTDIWAFGCVLYEMLLGRRAFGGATVTDTLAAIVERQPDWSALPATTPDRVQRLLRHCLEKDPKRRLRDVGDAHAELEELLAPPTAGASDPAAGRPGFGWWAAGAIAVVVLAGLVGWTASRRSAPQTRNDIIRLTIPFVERPAVHPYGVRRVAISEDGLRVAYSSSNRVWIRRLDQKDAVAIGAGGSNPFFSADGEWVGMFQDVGLIKVPVEGGPPRLITGITERAAGGVWRSDGTIVFATTGGLYRVSADGGEPQLLAKPDRGRRERLYAWPELMPGGRSILFTVLSEDSVEASHVASLDLQTLNQTIVVRNASSPRYVSGGYLVYASRPLVKATAFDPVAMQARGDPVALPGIDPSIAPDNGAAEFAVSSTGTLVYLPAGMASVVAGDLRSNLQTLQWVDRRGKKDRIGIQAGGYSYPRVSPDGARVALDVVGAGGRDVWILNLERLSLTQLTDGPTEDMLPEWTPDGRRIFFASDRTGDFNVYSQAADGATGPRLEYTAPGFQAPQGFTPDGTRLLVYDLFKDVGMLALGGPARLEPLLHSEADERLPGISPDGQWIIYESDEAGKKFEIFVRPFRDVAASREKVSVDGGRYPRWHPKGTEIYYVNLDGDMMAVPVTLSPTLKLGSATKLFSWRKPPIGRSGLPYDVSRVDGRFIVTEPEETEPGSATQVPVVLNWQTELMQRVPTR